MCIFIAFVILSSSVYLCVFDFLISHYIEHFIMLSNCVAPVFVLHQIASVDERPGVQRELLHLENQVYDWQLKIYDLHLDILREEERLAKTQREAITRDIQGKLTQSYHPFVI